MSEPNVLRVLVADDEAGIRLGVRRALDGMRVPVEGYGDDFTFAVDLAADGEEARRKLDEERFDILLLDHSMPGRLGMEILEDLRGREGAPLTVMITAYASLDMAVRATKQGAFDFLAKPFTPDELEDVLEKASRHVVSDREARRLAKERRQVRFEFLSVLAHELKAPLGAVEGYLMLLEDGILAQDPEKTASVVGRCRERIGGMRKLIFDLLDLTRIESGTKQRQLGAVDVAVVVARVIETFTPEAERRGIELKTVLRGDTLMHADAGELEIILNNLVSNAVKYNRDAGTVTVRVDGGEPDRLGIAVSDTGIGMSPEETARLFGEFVRIRNEKTGGISGSGLGLSIVRRLARLCGGDVTVASAPDEGTTFTVTLDRDTAASEGGTP
ncbi:response regulator [bacterium]|nr:response regulator [bacterium]